MSDDISIVLESTDEIINVTIDDSVYAITNWGAIYGNISDQADLKSALDAKLDLADVSDSAEPGKVLRLNGSSSFDVNITGNAGTASSVQWTGVQNKPATYPPTAHAHTGVYQPAMGADDNYVTDAEKVKLSNLSGVNTGDQDLSGLCAGNDARLSDARTPLAHTTSSHSDWPASVSMTEVGYLDGVTSSIQTQLDEKENASNKGQALGYCPLDGSAKVAEAYLPDSVLGQVDYQGTWNATTNVPAIPVASTANRGHYYIVAVSGTTSVDGITDWTIGDWIISNGVTWNKVDNTDSVSSVFGRAGAIVANAGDYNASQITNTPSGNITAVTVQAAINELDLEKEAVGVAAGLLSTHTSTFDHTKLHDPVTVADSTSIDLTLTGQQISATAIFGTTAGTVAQGNDSRFVTNGDSHDHVGGDGAAIPLTSAVTGVLPIANGGTGSSTQNFVDLTSNQTIGGVKTFSSNVLIGTTIDDGVNKLQVNGSWSASAGYVDSSPNYIGVRAVSTDNLPAIEYQRWLGSDTSHVITRAGVGVSLNYPYNYAYEIYSEFSTSRTYAAGPRMVVTTSGNVLVGTTTDDGVNKLQVNGGGSFSGSLSVTGTLSASALPTTDPHVAGAFWRSGNTVMVSTG